MKLTGNENTNCTVITLNVQNYEYSWLSDFLIIICLLYEYAAAPTHWIQCSHLWPALSCDL